MKLTIVVFLIALNFVSCRKSKTFDTIVFEQQWPVCKDNHDCPFTTIDGARFITSAVFVIDHIKGMPIRNCPVLHKLDLSMLAGIKSDLDFAWPDWPEKDFRSESALQREWVIFASCFMEFMKSKEVWKDEQEFFEQVVSWYTEFQFADKLKMYRIFPGSIVYIDRLYHALRASAGKRGIPRIDCTVGTDQDGKDQVQLKHVALCFNVTTLEPVDCGNLYGGNRGACPKTLPISFPYPLPQNGSDLNNSVIFNISYIHNVTDRESMIFVTLLVLIMCFMCYLKIK